MQAVRGVSDPHGGVTHLVKALSPCERPRYTRDSRDVYVSVSFDVQMLDSGVKATAVTDQIA